MATSRDDERVRNEKLRIFYLVLRIAFILGLAAYGVGKAAIFMKDARAPAVYLSGHVSVIPYSEYYMKGGRVDKSYSMSLMFQDEKGSVYVFSPYWSKSELNAAPEWAEANAMLKNAKEIIHIPRDLSTPYGFKPERLEVAYDRSHPEGAIALCNGSSTLTSWGGIAVIVFGILVLTLFPFRKSFQEKP
ncbi:MAG: hypothetical protein LBQ81_05450 [Zoogloeaceae bacterium]|jgi:hypothetical protein|nr:hypothetical protein [Zoogloeaceae bacterium]